MAIAPQSTAPLHISNNVTVPAQGLFQGDISGHDRTAFGGGVQAGTGVEYDKNDWLTVGASLTGQALRTSDDHSSYSIVGSVSITLARQDELI